METQTELKRRIEHWRMCLKNSDDIAYRSLCKRQIKYAEDSLKEVLKE